jgi:hypothetical protein
MKHASTALEPFEDTLNDKIRREKMTIMAGKIFCTDQRVQIVVFHHEAQLKY